MFRSRRRRRSRVVGRLVFVLLSASPSKSLWSPCNSAMITLWHLVIVGFPGLFQGWFSWFSPEGWFSWFSPEGWLSLFTCRRRRRRRQYVWHLLIQVHRLASVDGCRTLFIQWVKGYIEPRSSMLESGLCPVIVIGARRRRAGRLIGTWFTSLRCAVAVVVPVSRRNSFASPCSPMLEKG